MSTASLTNTAATYDPASIVTDPNELATEAADAVGVVATTAGDIASGVAQTVAGAVGAVTGVTANPVSLYDYLVYKPNNAGRIWAKRKTIYSFQGSEAMYACMDRFLDSINWVQLMSWKNDSEAAQMYTISYSTGLSISEGSEINTAFNLGGTYDGLSMSANYSQKTFKTTETTSTKTLTVTVNVPAKSELIFYQKRYDFKDASTFVNDAWGQEWNVGTWGAYLPLTIKTDRVQIMAEEYYTATAPLAAGPGTVSVDPVSSVRRAGATRKRENTTDRCKEWLLKMGLY